MSFDPVSYLLGKQAGGGGGITPADNGKVVVNGALVAQTDETVTVNGVMDTTTIKQVTVNVQPPEPVESNDVNLYDYDGTLLYSYSAADFANLSEMPANPAHEGLTARGWNWTLADAKAYVAKYGILDIGQMYVTSDGATRIYFTLDSVHLMPYLGFALNGTAEIDWGDGSAVETVTGTSASTLIKTPHTYAAIGDYKISILVTEGTLTITGTTSYTEGTDLLGSDVETSAAANYYRKHITKIELGSGIVLKQASFQNCVELQSIIIPFGMTSLASAYAFQSCYQLKALIIPSDVTETGANLMAYGSDLSVVSLPKSLTTFGQNNTFVSCPYLKRLTLPDELTVIPNSFIQQCQSLTRIVVPDDVESIGIYFAMGCYSLEEITIPSGISAINTAFAQQCYNLSSVEIPASVTSIASKAFNQCLELMSIKFKGATPPTVANSDAWTSLPTDCIIYVPTGSLNDYKTETNYPDPTVYSYVEY